MKFHSRLLVSLASAALLASGVAMADNNMAQQHAPAAAAAQQASANVSDSQLKQFSNAQKKVATVRDNYQAKAENIDSAEDMQNLQTSMQKDMVKAVEKSGLDVDTYNKVAQLVIQDKGLQKRLGQMQ